MYNLSEDATKQECAAKFLNAIKRATEKSHQLLESNKLLSVLLKEDVSLQQYCCYLGIMQQVEVSYEQNVLPVLTPLLPFSDRAASLVIEEDKKNIPCSHANLAGIQPFKFQVQEITVPFALGFMYVMKGSKLGGKVITKHITRHLQLSAGKAAMYISDHGVDTFVLWRQFLSFFSTYVVEHNCEAAAIAGAEHAFAAIYDFFESNRRAYEI